MAGKEAYAQKEEGRKGKPEKREKRSMTYRSNLISRTKNSLLKAQ
jgi:hypothetical protein